MRGQLYVVWALVLLVGAGLISFRSTYEPDLWWHLAQGREVAAGRLVRTNLFSFAYRDYPQAYTSWLFDLGSYLLWTRIGSAAVQAAQAAVIAATLAIIAAACRVRASLPAAVAVCLFGWIILEPRAIPRPHLLSFLGIAICVALIERARAAGSWRPLRWAPLVVGVWSNVHVECVFGVATLTLFAAGEWLRPRDLSRRQAAVAMAIASAALAATMANPYGAGLLRYLIENISVPQILRIAELQPPYWPNYRAFFAWIMLGAALLTMRWRRVTAGEAVTILLFAAMGFRYLRLTPLVFLVSAPLIARCLDDLEAVGVSRRAAAVTALVLVLALARVPLIDLVYGVRIGGDALAPPALFSQPAMQFARKRGLSGPAFTSMNLGGYVAWELYPSAQVFIDSRLQAYPPGYFRAVLQASRDRPAWAALTAGVNWGVLSVPRDNEFSGIGRFDPAEWGVAYRDAAIEIVVRRDGPFGFTQTRFRQH
ncbi:MAG: hypothetical protein ABIQ52_19240 [Vicinamibacterales bacterium]